MKTLVTALAAATALTAVGAGVATAQPYGYAYGQRYERPYDRTYERDGQWMSINERQARLDRRIDRGLRTGELTRNEAWRLRNEFRRIAYLESRYRMNGLSAWERADLDRRFDALSAQIRFERRDGDRYGYNEYPRY